MDQQVAEFQHGIVEIVTEYVLAEVLDKDPADRASVVENAAVVTRTRPQLVAPLRIIDQRSEERGL